MSFDRESRGANVYYLCAVCVRMFKQTAAKCLAQKKKKVTIIFRNKWATNSSAFIPLLARRGGHGSRTPRTHDARSFFSDSRWLCVHSLQEAFEVHLQHGAWELELEVLENLWVQNAEGSDNHGLGLRWRRGFFRRTSLFSVGGGSWKCCHDDVCALSGEERGVLTVNDVISKKSTKKRGGRNRDSN